MIGKNGPSINLHSWSEQKTKKIKIIKIKNSKFYVVKTVVAIFRKYENKSKKKKILSYEGNEKKIDIIFISLFQMFFGSISAF